jgi:hypothetical protein
LEQHSFHLVVATDVVYDLKMIRPMLQTAFDLLRDDGYFIVSHVPRFCLPKSNNGNDEEDGTSTNDDDNIQQQPATQEGTKNVAPHVRLEEHIVEEATRIGFLLMDTIRPHHVLQEPSFSYVVEGEDDLKKIDDDQNDEDDDDGSSKYSKTTLTVNDMEEAHAVVFVFRSRST